MPFYKFKSAKPNNLISDSESLLSEGISTEPKIELKIQDFNLLLLGVHLPSDLSEGILVSKPQELSYKYPGTNEDSHFGQAHQSPSSLLF